VHDLLVQSGKEIGNGGKMGLSIGGQSYKHYVFPTDPGDFQTGDNIS